jgi:hypothetical protein
MTQDYPVKLLPGSIEIDAANRRVGARARGGPSLLSLTAAIVIAVVISTVDDGIV